jgi:hypothetical protein
MKMNVLMSLRIEGCNCYSNPASVFNNCTEEKYFELSLVKDISFEI